MPQFFQAAKRHWNDARFLMDDSRMANADHLFGLAAECALKSMLRGLGMEMSGNMPAPGRFRSHIDSIWEHFQTYAYSRSGIRYLDQLCCLPQSPFSDWRIDQRYESGDLIQKEAVAIHRKACEQLNACLEAALLDGMLDADSF